MIILKIIFAICGLFLIVDGDDGVLDNRGLILIVAAMLL